jgi:hypothetical protein
MPTIVIRRRIRLEESVPFHRFLALFVPVILAAMCHPAAAAGAKASGVDMQEPPDYEAAVRSEFERVKAEDTVDAYERFIRRHPDHPLVEEAREALARLKK